MEAHSKEYKDAKYRLQTEKDPFKDLIRVDIPFKDEL